MSEFDIIRAVKDREYRESLTEGKRYHLSENISGMVDLSNDEMEQIQGGCAEKKIRKIKYFRNGKVKKKKYYK